MDVAERIKVIELIQAVIASDGVVAEEERAFLRRIVERFGLGTEYSEGHGDPSDAGRITSTLRALAPDVQARVMALLVDAAVADGRVRPQERAILLASAAALGIEADALEERISLRLKSSAPGG
ncbi:hypothetical protein AKJ09_09293 [Labilithrix luteola]|uniref:Co-chaperone DjlA N-terminal domain-containing protein n=1 Tax=Labilithrix luteola TaxID=1391654 RepID=A0A0K1QB39_9BACT|nr:TerB family tellurite resistance protein [Labilithrix luteola]AKV02630.1 hypothetical protein AKJ09_09293 [Labilithrix luteola]